MMLRWSGTRDFEALLFEKVPKLKPKSSPLAELTTGGLLKVGKAILERDSRLLSFISWLSNTDSGNETHQLTFKSCLVARPSCKASFVNNNGCYVRGYSICYIRTGECISLKEEFDPPPDSTGGSTLLLLKLAPL